MNFESIGTRVFEGSLKNIKTINSLRKEINEQYMINLEIKAELIKEDTNGKFKEYREKIEDSILKCNKDIKLLDKLERKSNGYKTIKIENDRDYDSSIVRIIFPKGTKKKFIENWLINNDYPIRTQHFHINSDYDCTGKIHTIWVSEKANVVEIEYCYDV